jgi:uncharacterized protein (TIGR02996 family)
VITRPEVLGLLQHIKQQPDDPSLRLILADWLDDHAEHEADRARAEILRFQVRGDPNPGLRRLESAFSTHWLGPLAPWCQFVGCHGGLLSLRINGQNLASAAFQALADSEAWAWVDGLEIRSPLPRRLRSSPLLQRLSSLFLPQMPSGSPIAELAESPWLESIRRLNVSGWQVTHSEAELLFASPHLRPLRELNFSRSLLSPRTLRTLAPLRLRRLVLSRATLGDGEIQQLAQEPSLSTVEELDLTDNAILDSGAFALADSPYLTRVQVLTLFGNLFGVEARQRLRERFGARVLFVG